MAQQEESMTPYALDEEQKAQGGARISRFDDYFESIQTRKKLPFELQVSLTAAFAKIPVSSFPDVPGGKVVEISADTSVADAVRILSEKNILAAPVRNSEAKPSLDWRDRYLGIIDYSAIILWVLENAELAAVALSAGSATAAGVGAGALGALGALAFGATGPVAVAGLTVAAVGAAVAGGVAVDRGIGKDAATAANNLGEDFYKILLKEEPFKSTTVQSLLKAYRWGPFIPVSTDSSMLSVLLLLSKYRMRNVPVIQVGKPSIRNFITQSAIVKGLEECKGRDWFDSIAKRPLSDLGLPFISPDQVICINSNDLILEAFKLMKDHKIGGLPVVEGEKRKIVGNVSIRDIRFLLLKPDLFSNFRQLTVIEFMKTLATSSECGRIHVTPPTICKPDELLENVIQILAFKGIHRIYVVGKESEVIGVVTIRDVISCFIYEPPDHFDNYFGFAMKEMLDKY
ncbi:SNF1-related protein kinase regulatory subunit gamma-1-like [Aristolochia californica]|uniref:SNF1-related protein kinase regulatory subunit gamma-1-like n=1 Tax=Aristolochia californica TaxID=171875 RepID=UPI0035DF67FA